MNGVTLIRQILRAFNIENPLRAYCNDYSRIENRIRHRTSRALKGTDIRLLSEYLKSHEIKKLQIGCGSNALAGWLNSDYYPRSKSVFHLDATKSFPIDT
jgi:hypothetical protein